MGYFAEQYNNLRFPYNSDGSGLRNAQRGAIYAIGSHSTLYPDEAAIVVMPTGSGKTSVLMMAPYMLQKEKVLIVTPSIMVRGQIFDDFGTLRTLKRIGVFDESIPSPNSYELKKSYSEDQKEDIQQAVIVVATPQVALTLSESDIKTEFDYIIIDEAHHVPAETWQKILANMSHASSLLVTATPFRLDKKTIKGRLIYTYPLSRAYQDGIFGEINYIPIDEAPNKDILIAHEAERIFLNDREQGFLHYLMVRTDTKDNAKLLEQVYKDNTSLKLKRIDSSTTYSSVQKTIEELRKGEIDGIICVNMLGEGFDFPNLKIAAIHEPHKSLASTLQFIGRFARTNAPNIGSAKFIAMNDEQLRIENRKLFSSDAIWQDMIIDMSEKKIGDDLANQDAIRQFVKSDGGSDAHVSLHNIRPNCHAKVFRVTQFFIDNAFPTVCEVGDEVYRDYGNNTIIAITQNRESPIWLAGSQVSDVENLLYIVHFQKSTSLLFIYSQNKSELVYTEIAEAFATGVFKIPRNEMHRVLGEMTNYEFFNTGMQNRYAENGESYRIYAGSNTAAAIDESTGRMRSAGHAFCKGLKEGVPVTIGYSSGSKVWSSTYLPIPEYIAWCDEYGTRIANTSLVVKTNTNYDFLPLPQKLNKYPKNIIFCFFDEKTYTAPPSLYLGGNSDASYLLTDITLLVSDISDNSITFSAEIEGISEQISCNTEGQYTSITSSIFVKDGRKKLPLSTYFNTYPLQFKTTDDTLIAGNEILTGNPSAVVFSADSIIPIDWKMYKTDIRTECSTKGSGKVSIQDTIQQILENDPNYDYLIFDHGTGEIADFIAIKETDNSIQLSMYHAKAMRAQKYNSDVNDIYEVLQQAVKSSIWIKTKSTLLQKILSRRKSGHCELLKGRLDDLRKLLRGDKRFVAEMYVVQPSISKSVELPSKYQEVLAAARFYTLHSGRIAKFCIWGSQ